MFLVYTRIASFRIILGVFLGMVATSVLLNAIGSDTNPMMAMPWYWHLVLGGFAFGMVFMVTDPVTSPLTPRGAWIFGIGVGALVVLIRAFGGFPEGVMYAILLMNAAVPLIERVTQPRVFGRGMRR